MLSERRSSDDPSLAQVLAAHAQSIVMVFHMSKKTRYKARLKRAKGLAEMAMFMQKDMKKVKAVYIFAVDNHDGIGIGLSTPDDDDRKRRETVARNLYRLADNFATDGHELISHNKKGRK
jgi:hypothetical protein